MKTIGTFLVALLLLSCYNVNSNDHLQQRITRLEQQMDSLTGKSDTSNTGSIIVQKGRCQAITKRGKQCRRKAKANGYCWQHADQANYKRHKKSRH